MVKEMQPMVDKMKKFKERVNLIEIVVLGVPNNMHNDEASLKKICEEN